MTCINKSNKNYKLAKARYGDSFAESVVRNISKSKGLIDDFYYPTIQEIKDYYKGEIKKKETLIFDALKNNTNLTLKTITDLLQGVIHKHNGIYFVTQGFGNNQSFIIKADNYTMIYRPNLEIIKKLEEMYPDIFSRTYVVKYTPPGASSNLSFVVENLNLKGREKIFDDYDLEVFKTPSKERNTILKIARIYRDVPLSINRPFVTRLTINPKLILTPVKEEVETEESLLNENLRTLGFRERQTEIIQKEGQFISSTGNIYSSLQEALIDKDGKFEEKTTVDTSQTIKPKVPTSTQLDLFDNTLFRLNNKIIEKSIPELDNILFDYLKPFNIKYEDIDVIKRKYNVNSLGAVDIIQKVMYLAKERDIYTVPEEFSHLIVMLMGESNPIISNLLDNIENWSEYEKIKEKYFNTYKGNIKKIKVEAIGQLLSKAIVNNWKSKNKEEQSWFSKLKQLIINFFNKVNKQDVLLNELANRIAINVLTKNNVTNISAFKTYNTGLRNLGIAYRGSGNYYALDRPFTTGKISEEIRIVQVQYNTKRVLDLTKFQETNIPDEDSLKYEKILKEAKTEYDKLSQNSRKLNTYNDLIQQIAIKNNIDGLISYIEPGAPDINTMRKIGREFVEYKSFETLINIPDIKNKIPVNYSKELIKNKLAQYVVNMFKNIKGINLTGSLAISLYQDIWRDPQNAIHDLDFEIDSNYTNKYTIKDFFNLLNKPNIEIAHNGWKANKVITFSFYILPEKYSFDKTKTIRDTNGRVNIPYLDLTVLDEKGNEVKSLELLEKIELIGVDFFWPLFPKKSISIDNTTIARDVFNGKLQLGNKLKTPEVFFQRLKDQNDYILSNYTMLTDPILDNLYFRLDDNNEIIENAKTALFDKSFRNKIEKLQNGEKVIFSLKESDYLYNILSDTIKVDLKNNNINNFNEFINSQKPSSILTRIINYLKSLLFQQKFLNIIDKIKSSKIDNTFTEEGNLIIKGITENQKSLIPILNKILFKSITPANYNKSRVINKSILSLFVGRNYEDFVKTITEWHNADNKNEIFEENKRIPKWATEITEEQYYKREDAWRLSNGLPQQHNTFKYIGRGHFDINFNFIPSETGEDFYEFSDPLFKSEDIKLKKSIDKTNFVMGKFDLRTGQDEYGHFLQYNDRWDIDIKDGLIGFVVNFTQKPFNVTGKIYNAMSFDNEGNEFIYLTYDKDNPDLKNYNNLIELSKNYPTNQTYYEERQIKPGVAELFESDQILANAVYKALGFNTVKDLPILNIYNNTDISNAEKDGYKINIDNKLYLDNSESKDSYFGYWMPIMYNGKDIGRVRFEEKINKINGISVKTFNPNIQIYKAKMQEGQVDYTQKGIGTKVHIALYKYVKSKYPTRPFVSDVQNTIAEIGLLKSLERKGVVTQINPIGELSEKYNNYSTDEAPFIFNDDYFNNTKQITLEQKQQALQLYSQYIEQNPNGNVEQFKSWVDEFNRNNQKLNSNIQIFSDNKKGDFDSSSLKDDDLALMLFNKASGANVKSIDEITFDNVQYDTTKKDFAFFGGFSRDRSPSLSEVLNQTGMYPEHIMFIGESKVYPNFYEILEKQNGVIENSVKENFDKIFSFGFTSSVFDQIKKELNNSKSETFVFETADGKTFKFPKRFVKGFYKLTSKISQISEENRQNVLDAKVKQIIKEKRESNEKGIKPVIVKEFYNDGSTDILKYAIELIDNSIIKDAVKNAKNIKVVVFSNKEFSEEGVAAWYQPNTNSIYIYEENLRIDKGAFQLLAHELIHGVTHLAINYDTSFKNEIKKLIKEVENKTGKKYKKGNEDSIYGLKDEHEFLSEAFSNPLFKQLLESIEEEKETSLSLWQKFINAIFNLFNKDSKYKTETYKISTLNKLNSIIQTNNFKFYNVSNINDNTRLANFISQKSQERLNQIQELFESTPELANAVYEALGFKQSNLEAANRVKKAEEDIKQIHKIGIDTEYEDVVKSADKNRFHFLDTNDFKNTNQKSVNIEHIHVPEKYRNKGYGLSLYIVRGEELLKEGKYLISYDQHSPEAEIVWQRLLQLGLATQSGEYGTYQYVGIQNQITPQQKQQALQQYSQYLDTVFPDSKVKDIVYHGSGEKIDQFKDEFKATQNPTIFDSPEYDKLGFFFTTDKNAANTVYAWKFDEQGNGIKTQNVNPSIVNIINPQRTKFVTDLLNVKNIDKTKDGYIAEESSEDYYIETPTKEGFTRELKPYEVVIVPKPEQIHILGSKQDIEGFKEFVGKSTTLIDTIDPIQNIVNKINSNFTEEDLNNQLNSCKI